MSKFDLYDWFLVALSGLAILCGVVGGVLVQNKNDRLGGEREAQVTHLCVAALAGRPPVEQVRLLAAFPECAPALADTTVTPRRGR